MSRSNLTTLVCTTHQESTRSVCPCVGFDARCHECPDPEKLPPCMTRKVDWRFVAWNIRHPFGGKGTVRPWVRERLWRLRHG